MYKVYLENCAVIFTNNSVNFSSNSNSEHKYLNENSLTLPYFDFTLNLIKVQPELKSITISCNNPKNAFKTFAEPLTEVIAAGGLIKKDNQYLLIYRLGFWDLPKGKAEPNENIQQTALREVVEECGIDEPKIIEQLPDTLHIYYRKNKWHLKRSIWFLMQSNFNGKFEPQTDEGITECCWKTEKEISALIPLAYPSIAELLKNYFGKN